MAIVEKGNRYGMFWSLADGRTQKPPYRKPLYYQLQAAKIFTVDNRAWRTVDIRNDVPLSNGFDLDRGVAASSNKALSKIYDRLQQSEALLVAWKERQSALDLVASNLRRLVEIGRAVKRRDPKVVRRVMKRNPKAKDVVKTPAGLWLEYHFAIVPTILDLHHACGILGFEFPVEKLSESSLAPVIDERKTSNRHYSHEYMTVTKIEGEVYGLNPNIHLTSMLGFGQPLSVAWEMTPFSWFIDYFVNVGELVTNLQPRFPGVRTRNHSTTTFIKCRGKTGKPIRSNPRVDAYFTFESVYMRRRLDWPSFQLEFNSPFDLSGQRCSYIAAVLVNLLASMKPKKS